MYTYSVALVSKADTDRGPLLFLKRTAGFVLLLCLCIYSGNSRAATGFNGAALSPINQFACTGNSITLNVSTISCTLATGPDWTAYYMFDSSADGGVTWFMPSGVSSGTCGASSPTFTYTSPPLAGTAYHTIYYRARLYSLVSNCSGRGSTFTSFTVSVNIGSHPLYITGPSVVCIGTPATFTDGNPGGTWSSTNMAVASVDAAGVVTAASTGTSTISYSYAGGCGTASVVTVSATSAISGGASICAGGSAVYTTTGTGTSWLSSNTAAATINAGTGVLNAVAEGNTVISYGACSSTIAVSVNPLPRFHYRTL